MLDYFDVILKDGTLLEIEAEYNIIGASYYQSSNCEVLVNDCWRITEENRALRYKPTQSDLIYIEDEIASQIFEREQNELDNSI